MKIPGLFEKKKKLQAATRAVPRRVMDDCEEPRMRLSSAFIVVLLLHVVAVGGIYAFNSIKTRQGVFAGHSAPAITPPQTAEDPATKTAVAPTANALPNKTAQKPVDPKQPSNAGKQIARDSGQVYTVVKGDNPVAIAKRFGVSYDELLKLNKIDDPKKLQIGQKLHIPPKIKAN